MERQGLKVGKTLIYTNNNRNEHKNITAAFPCLCFASFSLRLSRHALFLLILRPRDLQLSHDSLQEAHGERAPLLLVPLGDLLGGPHHSLQVLSLLLRLALGRRGQLGRGLWTGTNGTKTMVKFLRNNRISASHQQQPVERPHVVGVEGDGLAVVGLGQLYIFKATLRVADLSVSVGRREK